MSENQLFKVYIQMRQIIVWLQININIISIYIAHIAKLYCTVWIIQGTNYLTIMYTIQMGH